MVTTVKYVPVLRHREQERLALGTVKLSAKCLPLVEIIKEPPKRGGVKAFDTYYTEDLKALGRPVMVDFPMYVSTVGSTKAEVFQFLRPLQLDQNERIEHFRQLKSVPDLIPVVSYDPRLTPRAGTIRKEATALRADFKRLAFRLFPGGLASALAEVAQVAAKGDILLFDINGKPHTSSGFSAMYQQVAAVARKSGMLSVIIRSSINDDVKNVNFVDDQPVPEADNSLLKVHAAYGFDAFGDFAGIKKDNLYRGLGVSPGFLFYTWPNNKFIGYRSRYGDEVSVSERLQEFEDHIAPSVVASKHFTAQSTSHKANCPGCKTVQRIQSGTESGRNQAKWKGIAVMHYLYTMEERL